MVKLVFISVMKYLRTIALNLLLVGTLFFAGCVTPGSKGRISVAEETSRARVESVESMLGANLKDKLEQISAISYGVDYVLSDIESDSKEAKIARDLNTRTMSLTGAPNVEEMKKMRQMIDDLRSQLITAQEEGFAALEKKDSEIYSIQLRSKVLQEAKDTEIRRYMKLAQDTAARADAIQAELDKMNSFFGVGAIWYGVKRLITRMAWFIGIGSILYLFLRFASMSNPIAASIFSIFDQIMSWFVNLIRVLAPKALEVAGQTATVVADKYKQVMFKMIDNIEALQEIQKRDPTHKFTIDELLSELSKSMNDEEKKMIDKVKRDIGY